MSTFRSFLSLAHTHTHAVAVCGFYLALCGIMRLCQCEIIQVRQLWPLFSVFRSTKLLLIAFGFAFKPLLCFFFQLSLPLLFSGLTHSLRYCVDAGKRENLLSQVNATAAAASLLLLFFLGICRRFLLTCVFPAASFPSFPITLWDAAAPADPRPLALPLPHPAACAIYAALSNPKTTLIAQLYLYL